MSNKVIVRGPGEGRTLLVGGSDYVTYKIRSAETERAYFCFEVSATPGFGPPPHRHAYRELFYVLDGEYEFTLMQDGATRTVVGTPGTALAIEPDVPHTFRNVSHSQARLLITHVPAAPRSSSKTLASQSTGWARSLRVSRHPTSRQWPQRSSATACTSWRSRGAFHDRGIVHMLARVWRPTR